MRVSYQGVRGAYSEAALLRHFGPGAEASGRAFSEQVFEDVAAGKADCGFLPVENSIAGPVAVNADLLLSRRVFIIAESYLSIEHCLLAAPGGRLKDIKAVYSHPVALAQCRDFLKTHKMRAVPEYDTAGAAELVAERKAPGEAAIASRHCAKVYGLTVLRRGIQGASRNITRFTAFVRHDRVPPNLKMEKTSVAFTARHRPGALLECLKRFAEHKINLTRLESRPIPSNPFKYVFCVDFLGGMRQARVKAALREIEKDAHWVKILGSYPIGARP